MAMTGALADKGDEIQQVLNRHLEDTAAIQEAVQTIAKRLRSNAIDANEMASVAGDQATIAADIDVSGLGAQG